MAGATTTRSWTTYDRDVMALAGRMDKLAKDYFRDQELPSRVAAVLGERGQHASTTAIQKGLIEPGAYMLEMKSKRMRPVLFFTLMAALGCDAERYLNLCLIPEIIHNATLARDDIEDHSDLRRGVPTLHKKFGMIRADNFADFGYFWAMEDLVENNKRLSDGVKASFRRIFDRGMNRLVVGQTMDLEWGQGSEALTSINDNTVISMLYGKNGALMEMVARWSAAVAGADEATTSALANFCATLGIAHQLHDDLLNIAPLEESDVSANKGKVGEDITEGKVTFLVAYTMRNASADDRNRLQLLLEIHTADSAQIQEAISIMNKYGAIEHARKEERRLIDEAWAKVDPVLQDSDAKRMLKWFSEYVITRKN